LPTYDYICDECGYEFEAFHGMLADPLIDCPECQKPSLIKLIGAGGAVIIKGTKTPCRGSYGPRKQKKKSKIRKLDKLGEGKNKGKIPFW